MNPTEIFTGLWISSSNILDSAEWLKNKNINTILDCKKYFETTSINFNNHNKLPSNYYLKEKLIKFIDKCILTIYSDLIKEQNNILVVCDTGKRISLIVIIEFLTKYSDIPKDRIIQIVKTKLNFEIESDILNIIINL